MRPDVQIVSSRVVWREWSVQLIHNLPASLWLRRAPLSTPRSPSAQLRGASGAMSSWTCGLSCPQSSRRPSRGASGNTTAWFPSDGFAKLPWAPQARPISLLTVSSIPPLISQRESRVDKRDNPHPQGLLPAQSAAAHGVRSGAFCCLRAQCPSAHPSRCAWTCVRSVRAHPPECLSSFARLADVSVRRGDPPAAGLPLWV